ncbi:MAG: hypothetical protein PVJ02_12375 [Gemmatimonadota bacterium]
MRPSAHRFSLRIPAVLALTAWVAACGPAASDEGATSALPILALSASPTLEIGVMEGDPHYTFQTITSVVPLASGNLVVSDGGATEISEYAPDGTFVRRWGRRGGGPGEFRSLSRVYLLGTDSLMALDGTTRRVSVFDTAGTFAHQVDARDLSKDSLFAMDVWLYGRFWVDGALDAEARQRVRRALDRLPPPAASPGYRMVQVAADGRLWVREPGVDARGMRRWTILDAEGRPDAAVDIPVRFHPRTLGSDRMLGGWVGESDVSFVRAYGLRSTSETRAAPAWMSAAPEAAPGPAPDEAAFTAAIRNALKRMASAEEIHYAGHGAYTPFLDSLEWERPEDIVVDVVWADTRGWSAVFSHRGLNRICALAYGFTIPPGWSPGMIMCGPPAGPSTE